VTYKTSHISLTELHWDILKNSSIVNEEVIVEPSGVQTLKNLNPLKDVQGLVVLDVAEFEFCNPL